MIDLCKKQAKLLLFNTSLIAVSQDHMRSLHGIVKIVCRWHKSRETDTSLVAIGNDVRSLMIVINCSTPKTAQQAQPMTFSARNWPIRSSL